MTPLAWVIMRVLDYFDCWTNCRMFWMFVLILLLNKLQDFCLYFVDSTCMFFFCSGVDLIVWLVLTKNKWFDCVFVFWINPSDFKENVLVKIIKDLISSAWLSVLVLISLRFGMILFLWIFFIEEIFMNFLLFVNFHFEFLRVLFLIFFPFFFDVFSR